MSAEQRLAVDRANRDAAWRVFGVRLERIRSDVDARGIGSRVASSVAEEMSDAVDVGLDVARERKALVAGTFAAALLWFFRRPLFSAAASVLESRTQQTNGGIEDKNDDETE